MKIEGDNVTMTLDEFTNILWDSRLNTLGEAIEFIQLAATETQTMNKDSYKTRFINRLKKVAEAKNGKSKTSQ